MGRSFGLRIAASGSLLLVVSIGQGVFASHASAISCPTYTSYALAPFPPVHGTDISGCNLAGEGGGGLGTDFGGVTAVGTDFAGFNFSSNSTLGGANLTQANLSGANLDSITLGGANLTNADLIGTDLNKTNASGVNFTDANLSGALLTSTNLTGAVLTNATLTNADLDKANFTRATLAGVVSSGLTGTPVNLPAGWTVTNGRLVHGAALPGMLSVAFTSRSIALSSAAKNALSVLSSRLIAGAAVTITGYAKGSVVLAKSRAAAVSKYLLGKIKIRVTLKTVTNVASNKVTVITTKQ